MKKQKFVTARSHIFALIFAAFMVIPVIARAQGNGNEHWVGTWAASLHEPNLGVPGLANDGFNLSTLKVESADEAVAWTFGLKPEEYQPAAQS